MLINYRYSGNILILNLEGEYTKDQLRQMIFAALTDPECPANPRLLFDFSRSISITHRSTSDIQGLADYLGTLVGRFGPKVAFCAPSDLSFGLMRMGTVDAEKYGVTTEVFRRYEDALKWLES